MNFSTLCKMILEVDDKDIAPEQQNTPETGEKHEEVPKTGITAKEINKLTNDFLKGTGAELKFRGFKSEVKMKEGDKAEYQWSNENGDSVLIIIDKASQPGQMNNVIDLFISSGKDSIPKRLETLFVMPNKDGKIVGAGTTENKTSMTPEELEIYKKSIEEAKKLFTLFGRK